MAVLRERLRASIPELADALERCWDIAFDEWLPAMSPSSDSYNAYPHLRNHEKHLERICGAYERHHGPDAPPLLSPVELYVMLSAILFHDIGRTRTSDHHGEVSKVLLEGHRADLGIPSDALAAVIARISRFHDLPPSEMESELHRMSTTSIDPYGEIREDGCAALLTLIDYMDGTVTRVVPQYIKSWANLAPVGAFRRVIRDVEVDLEGQMVKVVLGDDPTPLQRREGASEEKAGDRKSWKLTPYFKRYTTKELLEANAVTPADKYKWDPPDGRPSPRILAGFSDPDMVSAAMAADCTQFMPPESALAGTLFSHLGQAEPDPIHQAIARQLLLAEVPADRSEKSLRKKKIAEGDLMKLEEDARCLLGKQFLDSLPRQSMATFLGRLAINVYSLLGDSLEQEIANRCAAVFRLGATSASWPLDLLLSIILCNTRENNAALRAIRRTLWTLGLPIKAWLIEWKEHLFNQFGLETHEPIFTNQELLRVAEAMILLTTRGLGQGNFRYETLAAEIREPSIAKTRRLVRRLATLTWQPPSERTKAQTSSYMLLQASSDSWRFIPSEQHRQSAETVAIDWFFSRDARNELLARLSEPQRATDT